MKESRTISTNRQTRGGQIYFHEWRMRLQNLRMVLKISLAFLLIGFVISFLILDLSCWLVFDFYLFTYLPTQIKLILWPWLRPCLMDFDLLLKLLMPGSRGILSASKSLRQLTTELTMPNGKEVVMYSLKFISHPWIKAKLIPLKKAGLISIISWLMGVCYMFYRFKRKSDQVDREKHMRGKKVNTARQIAREVIKAGQPNFYLSPDIPLPKGSENQHIAIFGATRMGKTNCIMGLLKQIRDKGERAIILDSTGEFTAKFYRKGKDKLLNPFDQRSLSWDIWQEDLPPHEYDAWAAALVPEGKGDPIWHGNARRLLAYTALKLKDDPAHTMTSILEWCCWRPLGNLTTEFYQNSAVASFMNKEAEKTAAGIRMQLSNTISAFEYLETSASKLSLTKWIAKEKGQDEWLFLTTLPSQRSTLAPLLASWFNLAFLGLERSGIDFNNRLWLIVDELPGLDVPISGLKRIVAEGAKYGACCILGFQNKSQIDHLYGPAITKTILSNCSTKVIFRSPDYETARDLSLAIGEQEIMTTTESYSVGAHQVRDGVNLSSQHQKKFAVTPDEIISLNPLEAYILLPGNYPTAKTKFKLNNYEELANNFEPKIIEEPKYD